jgi:hypothetical protein
MIPSDALVSTDAAILIGPTTLIQFATIGFADTTR